MKGHTHMKLDIVRAWKDESYRQQLNNEQLPENPAGILELTDSELEGVSGSGGYGGFGGRGGFGRGGYGGYGGYGGLGYGGYGGYGCRELNSFASLCDVSAFSANPIGQANFLSPVVNICFINN
jgi:mersacidin/lichenicidin family type 2 lantibiotic